MIYRGEHDQKKLPYGYGISSFVLGAFQCFAFANIGYQFVRLERGDNSNVLLVIGLYLFMLLLLWGFIAWIWKLEINTDYDVEVSWALMAAIPHVYGSIFFSFFLKFIPSTSNVINEMEHPVILYVAICTIVTLLIIFHHRVMLKARQRELDEDLDKIKTQVSFYLKKITDGEITYGQAFNKITREGYKTYYEEIVMNEVGSSYAKLTDTEKVTDFSKHLEYRSRQQNKSDRIPEFTPFSGYKYRSSVNS